MAHIESRLLLEIFLKKNNTIFLTLYIFKFYYTKVIPRLNLLKLLQINFQSSNPRVFEFSKERISVRASRVAKKRIVNLPRENIRSRSTFRPDALYEPRRELNAAQPQTQQQTFTFGLLSGFVVVSVFFLFFSFAERDLKAIPRRRERGEREYVTTPQK